MKKMKKTKKTSKIENKLLGIEIYKKTEDIQTIDDLKEKLKKAKEYFYEIIDLNENYIVKVIIDETGEVPANLEPTEVSPLDVFELNESIINILKNHGIKAKPLTTDKDLDREINKEAIQAFKEIAKKMSENMKKKAQESGQNQKEGSDG